MYYICHDSQGSVLVRKTDGNCSNLSLTMYGKFNQDSDEEETC